MTCTPADRRLGFWSSLGIVLIAVAYVLTGLAWVCFGGSAAPERLEPTDPYLAILESLIVLSAPLMIVVMASIHAYAPPEGKTSALVALTLMAICAALTVAIHFLNLTVVRRLPAGDPRLALTQLYPWPGFMLGLNLVAWDLFFGLAMLFAAPAFRGDKLEALIRGGLRLGGGLCLVGVLAQAVGNLWLRPSSATPSSFRQSAGCSPCSSAEQARQTIRQRLLRGDVGVTSNPRPGRAGFSLHHINVAD